MLKKKDLINFEDEIAKLFNNAQIKAPIHLYSNNEDILINFFITFFIDIIRLTTDLDFFRYFR